MDERLALPGGDPEEPAMITYRVGQPRNRLGRRTAARRVARAAVDRDRAALRRVDRDSLAARFELDRIAGREVAP